MCNVMTFVAFKRILWYEMSCIVEDEMDDVGMVQLFQ